MNDEFASFMRGYDNDPSWEQGQSNPNSGSAMLEQGEHQVEITSARVERSDTNGEWQWRVRYQALDGSAGVTQWYNLEQSMGREIAGKVAAQLGYQGPLTGLQIACEAEAFIGIICDVYVKDKPVNDKIYKTVFINAVHGRRVIAAAGEEDLPF